jgi:hypothetical protein
MSANFSLAQGQNFAKMTSTYHGGRKTRRQARKMRGGAMGAPFPGGFDILPQDMHQLAGVAKLDAAFNQLPEFAGKYGMSGGRMSRKKMRGGVAELSASNMLLTPAQTANAGLHPQWTNENLVVPSYVSPDSVLPQKAGKRKSRKGRKASRKGRKMSRKGRKASRKGRKMSRKGSRKERKGRKASRKGRKASRKA